MATLKIRQVLQNMFYLQDDESMDKLIYAINFAMLLQLHLSEI